jgi:hypothetical protein
MGEDKFVWNLDEDIEILPDEAQGPHDVKQRQMLLETVFNGDTGLFEEFSELYDTFVRQHSRIPFDRAMIAFREKYEELPGGKWRAK